jgi:hypothetical protein
MLSYGEFVIGDLPDLGPEKFHAASNGLNTARFVSGVCCHSLAGMGDWL